VARKRDYKKEYVRRQELARLKGYKSYYDYRLHRHGKRPPGTDVPKSVRGVAGGKRGTGALLDLIESGRVEAVYVNAASFRPDPKFDIQVTLDDGSTQEFRLRGEQQVTKFVEAAADISPGLLPQMVGSPKAKKALQAFADEVEA